MGDDPIRLVLMVPQSNRIVTQEGLLRTAEAAEELRFYGVSVRDHISFNHDDDLVYADNVGHNLVGANAVGYNLHRHHYHHRRRRHKSGDDGDKCPRRPHRRS